MPLLSNNFHSFAIFFAHQSLRAAESQPGGKVAQSQHVNSIYISKEKVGIMPLYNVHCRESLRAHGAVVVSHLFVEKACRSTTARVGSVLIRLVSHKWNGKKESPWRVSKIWSWLCGHIVLCSDNITLSSRSQSSFVVLVGMTSCFAG